MNVCAAQKTQAPLKGADKMKTTQRKRNKGFTLLEILAALAVLAVGLVSVLSLFPMGFQSTKRAAETSVASLY